MEKNISRKTNGKKNKLSKKSFINVVRLLFLLCGLTFIFIGCGTQNKKVEKIKNQALDYYNEKYDIDAKADSYDYLYRKDNDGILRLKDVKIELDDDNTIYYDSVTKTFYDTKQVDEITKDFKKIIWGKLIKKLGKYYSTADSFSRVTTEVYLNMQMFGDSCFNEYYDGNIKDFCKKGIVDYRYCYSKTMEKKWAKNDIYIIANGFYDYDKKFREIEAFLEENGLEKVYSPKFNFISEDIYGEIADYIKKLDKASDTKKSNIEGPDVGKTYGYWAKHNWGQACNKHVVKLSKGIYAYYSDFIEKESDIKIRKEESKKDNIISSAESIYRIELDKDYLDSITDSHSDLYDDYTIIEGGDLYLMIDSEELGVSPGSRVYLYNEATKKKELLINGEYKKIGKYTINKETYPNSVLVVE